MSEPRTFQDVQAEFVRTHPGLTFGTALPTAEMMRDTAFTEAINALSERIHALEKRMDALDDAS